MPPKASRMTKRACGYALYRERNLIKHFRGIATRYEKTARNLLADLNLVCALAWAK